MEKDKKRYGLKNLRTCSISNRLLVLALTFAMVFEYTAYSLTGVAYAANISSEEVKTESTVENDASVSDEEQAEQGASEDVTDIPEENTEDAAYYPAFAPEAVEIDGAWISVSAPEGSFPADAILDVSKVTDEGALGKAGEAVDEISEGSRDTVLSYLYDIRVFDAQGNELELAEGQTADISVTLSEEVDQGLDSSVYRITDTGEDTAWNAEQQDAIWNTDTNTVEFNTDRLSLYALEFTGKSTQETAEQEGTKLKAAGQKAADVTVDSWSALQNAVNNAPNDTKTVIALSSNCTASSGQDRIRIGEKKIIELDLAGHTLNRNRTSSHKDGHVIEVFGYLTVTDSSADDSGMNGKGVITGGFAGRGGGINISTTGVCELQGGTIKGNKASTEGGGVFVHGIFRMSGGSISDNETTGKNSDGGGIFVNGDEGATLEITGGRIDSNTTQTNNDKGGNGGGVMATSGSRVSISNATFNNNSSRKHGAALYTEASIDISGCDFEDNYTIVSSSQRIETGQFNNDVYYKLDDAYDGGAIYLDNGAVLNISSTEFLRNRVTNWAMQGRHASGGAIYVNSGKLNISDSAFEENKSWEGGAIYSKGGTEVSAVNTTFSSNFVGVTHHYSDSNAREKIPVQSKTGGAIASYGTLTLKGCTITGNRLTDETDAAKGGGIYSEGTLTMDTVTCANNSGRTGGGVYVKGSLNVKGKTIINDNSSWKGNDVYLPSGKVITLKGPLGSDSDIGVALENKFGVFSKGFTENHPGDIPETFFYSCDGYDVILKDNEGYIQKGTLDDKGRFIGWKDRISPNPNRLNGPNWMSGLSGERYLNEINMPGSHDSSMNNVSRKGCLSGKIGQSQAKTQEEYINEQLEHGIRFFDIRMRTSYCSGEFNVGAAGIGLALPVAFIPYVGIPLAVLIGTVGSVMILDDSCLPQFKDDGKNLWTCHGRSKAGVFYAMDQNGDWLSLSKELEWMKAFLADHPTETIIIDYRPETDDVGGGEYNKVLDRFNGIMEELTNEKNPATGESYVYWEDGKVGKRFKHWPKLKDCRGKIVLWAKLEETADKSGGIWRDVDGITTEKPKGTYKDAEDRARNLLNFFSSHASSEIPKNAMNGQMKKFYWIEMNTTDPSFSQTPVELAKLTVLNRVFGSGGAVNESKKGTYFGWFGIDAVKENFSRDVWITNFPDDLDYCRVTVESGLSGSGAPETQTYKLLRGTTITIPGCIYDVDKANKFLGWEADVDGKLYTMNDTYRIVKNVTFTAKWSDQIKTPVTVVWKDAENLDGIRPEDLVISYNYDGTKEETVEASKNWTGMLTGDFTDDPVVKVVPEGYTATVDGSKGKKGYTITMTHNPDIWVNARGTVTWYDSDDMDHIRPDHVTLRLYANGKEVASGTASENSGWSFDLGTHLRYKDGEMVAYRLAEDEIDVNEEEYLSGYTIGVEPVPDPDEKNAITGFIVTNTHEVTTSVMYARVEWDDDNDAAGERPESVKVRWLKNGEPYSDWIDLEPDDESEWVVGLEITYADMKKIAQKQEELAQKFQTGEITEEQLLEELESTMSYTIEQETVDGYATAIQLKDGEESDDGSSGAYYQILNAYGKHSLTFYSDSEGTEVWQTKLLNDGASIKEYEEFGMKAPDLLEKDGYTFAGWAKEKNVSVDSYCDKKGNLNPELDGKLVDWDTTKISEDMALYPIWIRDRIHVTIVPGGDDPDTEDPEADVVHIDDEQALSFTANIGEKIVMRYLIDADREGYDLVGWYTDGGELWNGENWKTLDYVSEGWTEKEGWGVEPDRCDKDESGKPVIHTNKERRFNYYTLTLTAEWKVKQFTVEYKPGDHGTFEENKHQNINYGEAAPAAPDAANNHDEGYAFAGWINDATGLVEDIAASVIANLSYTAQWSPNTDTAYKVEYYYEKDGGYTAVADVSEDRKGTTDKEASVTDKDKVPEEDGYVFDSDAENVLSGKIAGDGSLVLKVYFKQQFTVKYKPGEHGTFAEQETSGIDYNEETPAAPDAANKHDAGYTFAGWAPEVADTVTEDVTYVAQWSANVEIFVEGSSADKKYNGEDQSNSEYTMTFKVAGKEAEKPDGITITPSLKEASGKNAGSYNGSITVSVTLDEETEGYTIVTPSVTDVIKLKITPAAISIKADDKSKVYDNDPATDPELTAKVTGVPSKGTEPVYSLSREESQDAGEYAITVTADAKANPNYTVTAEGGKFTITKLDISDGKRFDVSQPADTRYNGEGQKQPVTVRDKTTGKELVADKDFTLAYSSDVTNAGTVTVTVTGKGNYSGDVTRSYKITQRTVRMTSADAEKFYDGLALVAKTVSDIAKDFDGFAAGEGAEYDVTGSQTLPGTSKNEFTYTLNEGTLAANYIISTALGTLTVKDREDPGASDDPGNPDDPDDPDEPGNPDDPDDPDDPDNPDDPDDQDAPDPDKDKYQVTFTAKSGEVTYDGKPHTVKGFVEENSDGSLTWTNDKEVKFTVTGISAEETQTDAGTYPVKVRGTARVTDPDGNDVTDQFTIKFADGTLKINPAKIDEEEPLDPDDPQGEKRFEIRDPEDTVYNGEEQKQPVTFNDKLTGKELVEGKDFTLVYSDDVTDAGSVAVTVVGMGDYAGTTEKTYEIKLAGLTLTSGSAEKIYDGSPLTNDEVTVEGLAEADAGKLEFIVTGSQTEVGQSDNTFEYRWADEEEFRTGVLDLVRSYFEVYAAKEEHKIADNYNVTVEYGTLKVTDSGIDPDDGDGDDVTPEDPDKGSTDNKKPVNTGDESDLTLWLMLMSLSAAALFILAEGRRKRSRR